MMFLLWIALGWLGIGSLVAVAILIEHRLSTRSFPERADWWLIPALTIGWPWAVWLWYVANTKIPQTARIGLFTFLLIGALDFGWGCGLKLYDSLYPKELEPPNTLALNAMVERIINNPSMKVEQTKIGVPPPLFTFR